jgi:ADP-ribosylglycohydrolase
VIGAIIGDVIGSVYEWNRTKEMDFPFFGEKTNFTDDTVLTIATAQAILSGDFDYAAQYKKYALDYPDRDYGGRFREWIKTAEIQPPYDSFGNGSAMRISPVGWLFKSLQETKKQARLSAACTHNHTEGIKGAESVAMAIYAARKGDTKGSIKDSIQNIFGYDLNKTINEIRPTYVFDKSCQGSVPQAIIAFLESTDFESAIRLAISLGGDSDTLACIAGSIAEAYYKEIPNDIKELVLAKLPPEFHQVIHIFYDKVSG